VRPAGGDALAALTALAGALAPGVAGQAAEPSSQAAELAITVRADTTAMHLGDQLILSFLVDHPPGAEVLWPDTFGVAPFEVAHVAFRPVAPDRTEARMTVTAFELGELEFPPVEVLVVDSPDTIRLVSGAVGIGVMSVGLDAGDTLRDVRGPRSIARNWLLAWPWALLLLAVVGGGLFLRRWLLRHRSANGARGPFAPAVPAHEAALSALDRLEQSPLVQRGRIKEFHIEVSQIFRQYMEDGFDVGALEMTTGEVMDRLRRAGGRRVNRLQDEHHRIRSFLQSCDLVKFARHRPGAAACGERLVQARQLVLATAPPPPTEETADEVAGKAAAA